MNASPNILPTLEKRNKRCAVMFSGTDSYGREYEYAQTYADEWYTREYGYNGYGMGWSKWRRCDDPRDAGGRVGGGFSADPLMWVPGPRDVRLPKNL